MSNPICYAELHAHTPAAAADFYRQLFGWKHSTSPMPKGTYHELAPADGPPAGVCEANPGASSRWLIYVQVDDLEIATARAVELGGKVIVANQLIPEMGKYSQVVDPSGASFGLWEKLPKK